MSSIDGTVSSIDTSTNNIESGMSSTVSSLSTVVSSLSSINGHASTIDTNVQTLNDGFATRMYGDPLRRFPTSLETNVLYSLQYGRNPDVDATGATEDIWNGGGTYTGFPTGSAETIQVFSSSTSDTSNGTGLRSMRVVGLDENYNVQTEDFVLNGTNAVTGSKLWRRTSRAYGLTAGSGGVNAGTVTVRHSSTTANVFCQMPVGLAETQVAAYTIPSGYRGLITSINIGASNAASTAQEAQVAFVMREYGATVWRTLPVIIAPTGSSTTRHYDGGICFQEKTDIVARVLSATTDNLTVSCAFEIFMCTT